MSGKNYVTSRQHRRLVTLKINQVIPGLIRALYRVYNLSIFLLNVRICLEPIFNFVVIESSLVL